MANWSAIGHQRDDQNSGSKGNGFNSMKPLKLSSRFSGAVATNFVASSIFLTCLALTNSLSNPAIAQSVGSLTCQQLTNRRYVVILDRPANQLEAVVHSFSAKVNDIPANLQAAVVLVELNQEPNMAIQQVQSLSGKSAVLATFNNRSVLLVAPLSSQQSASAIATKLRGQGLAAQVIGASLIASPATSSTSSVPTNSVPISNPTSKPTSTAKVYRVLVPNVSANTVKQIRELAPDAFVTIFKGKSYIQVRTYTNRSNAHRERDRLNARFAGTILIQD